MLRDLSLTSLTSNLALQTKRGDVGLAFEFGSMYSQLASELELLVSRLPRFSNLNGEKRYLMFSCQKIIAHCAISLDQRNLFCL